jgi:hypothetical protein
MCTCVWRQILDEPIPEDCHPEQHADYAGIGLSWGLDHKTASAAQCVALLHAHLVHAQRQQQHSDISTARCNQQGSATSLETSTTRMHQLSSYTKMVMCFWMVMYFWMVAGAARRARPRRRTAAMSGCGAATPAACAGRPMSGAHGCLRVHAMATHLMDSTSC